ncbi:MAG: Ribonuclease toxin, BrnT, of type toxin-antitoxin system [Pseudomonadota bacterium]|jgi:uncharacterized DUF497 family protein
MYVQKMDGVMYVWDEEKNRKDQIKHRVGFQEAQTVFEDPFAIIGPNENGSEEARQIISARTLTRADKKSLGWL